MKDHHRAVPSIVRQHQRAIFSIARHHRHLHNARTADYLIIDVDHDGAVFSIVQTRSWSLDDFDGIEHFFQE
jgi:hypothetical protein